MTFVLDSRTPIPRSIDKEYQHSVAEHGMSNPAMAYPRNSKQQMVDYRVHLNIRSRATEQHSEDILKPREVDREQKEVQPNKFQMQYDTSRNTKNRWSRDLQEELQGKLITKDQELRDLTDKLAQKDQEIDNIRRQWKGAARELGKHQARGKVRDQVTDPELMQKARQLQYNVRNFTCQHFGGELDTGKSFQAACHHLQKNLEVSSAFFDACIRSEVKRPLLVIALLWDFLMNDIFGRFWWGGKRVHIGMDYLTDALEKPSASEVLADELEATRKYQMWKANTSALLEDALKHDEETEQGISRKLHDIIKDLCWQLGPLTTSKTKRVEEQMFDIIQEALDLDQLFSKQIAQVFWTTADSKGRDFDEELMELQQGEKRTADSQKVQLVVAPGLVKNGRSTGEDYERTNVLLKVTVSYELLTSASPGRSHKPSLPPREFSKAGAKVRNFLVNTTK